MGGRDWLFFLSPKSLLGERLVILFISRRSVEGRDWLFFLSPEGLLGERLVILFISRRFVGGRDWLFFLSPEGLLDDKVCRGNRVSILYISRWFARTRTVSVLNCISAEGESINSIYIKVIWIISIPF